ATPIRCAGFSPCQIQFEPLIWSVMGGPELIWRLEGGYSRFLEGSRLELKLVITSRTRPLESERHAYPCSNLANLPLQRYGKGQFKTLPPAWSLS
ncbi:hypothetical protein MYX84_08195, partial [Acidobacteria bacterium AH-259-O06]|nr:hypothetical protein [Acidobacteria bacterium AH-259-O06]